MVPNPKYRGSNALKSQVPEKRGHAKKVVTEGVAQEEKPVETKKLVSTKPIKKTAKK